jgi:hypothetical protein
MEAAMSDNPTTCGNCQTENDPDNDFCSECGQPLTRSAEEGIVEQQQAQNTGSLVGGIGTPQAGTESAFRPGTDTTTRDGLPSE